MRYIFILLLCCNAYAGFVPLVSQQFNDALFAVYDNLDASKKIAFQASGLTTATTRTYTWPDSDGTVMLNLVEDATPQLGGDLDGQSTYDLVNMVDGTFSGALQVNAFGVGLTPPAAGNATITGTLSANILKTTNQLSLTYGQGGYYLDLIADSGDYIATRTLTLDVDANRRLEVTGDSYINQDVTTSGTPTFGTVNATTITGNSLITGGNIGIAADPDLLSLAANALTVNGNQTWSNSTTTITYGDAGALDNVVFKGRGTFGSSVQFTRDDAANSIIMAILAASATCTIVEQFTLSSTNEGIDITAATAGKDITLTSPEIILTASTGVGIGTTSPDDSLQVVGSSGFGDDAGNEVIIESDGDMVFKEGAGLAFGDIHGRDESSTVTIAASGIANKVQITAFDTVTAEHNMDANHTDDHISVTYAGFYKCTVSISIESAGGGGADKIGIGVYKNNGATLFENCHTHRKLAGGGGDVGSASISGIIDLAASDTIEVWVWNEDSTDDVIVDDITLSLVQVGGT